MDKLLTTIKGVDPDNLFAYSTLKIVTIRDRRLGMLHYLLQLGIFIYIIVWTIIIQRRYLLSEIPFGSIRSTLQEPAWIDASTVPYCLQQQPKYVNRNNYNCTYMLGRDSQYPPAEKDSIFVTTRIKDIYLAPPPNCTSGVSATGVPTDFACAPSTTASSTTRYYIAAVEKYTVYIEHAVYGQITDITATNENLKGTLTFNDGSEDLVFGPGSNVRKGTGDVFAVDLLLKAAGISSLDSDSTINAANTMRYDGLLVLVAINYENRQSDVSSLKYRYSLHVLPGVDVVNMEPSTVVDGQVFQRSVYGIRFMFIVAGTIGKFDFPTLLTSVVSGLVLLKVASTIVDLLLLYAMPDKSIYKKHKYEMTEDFSEVRQANKDAKKAAEGDDL